PEWVAYNEFVLTKRHYIRTVTEVRPEWLLEIAPHYYDLPSFPPCEGRRILEKIALRMTATQELQLKKENKEKKDKKRKSDKDKSERKEKKDKKDKKEKRDKKDKK
ncbi:DEAH-box ATP-dependent RNA helicase prp43, partial [Coemansia sp. RSA 486]